MSLPHPPTPSTDQPNTWLELAIRNRLNDLPDADKIVFTETSDTSTEDELLSYSRKYDSEHIGLPPIEPQAEAVSRFVRSLVEVTSVISGSSSKPNIVRLIPNGVRSVIALAMKCEPFFTKLIEMLCLLANYIQPLGEYARSENVTVIEQMAAVYGDLLTFCRDLRCLLAKWEEHGISRSIWTFIRTHWDPFEAEFKDLRSKLRLHQSIAHHCATPSEKDESYRGNFLVKLDGCQEENKEKAKEKKRFLEWLSAPDYEKRHTEIYSTKHPGTGDWLNDTDEVQTWLKDSKERLLWIYGKAGIGKSVLASNLVERISAMYALDRRVCILYVYYDYRDKATGDPTQVISGLMKQACRGMDEIPDWMLTCKRETPKLVRTMESFLKIRRDLGDTFLIVDGLDECPAEDLSKSIDLIDTISDSTDVKVLITSREHAGLSEHFHKSGVSRIEIQPDRMLSDIKTFISDEVERVEKGDRGSHIEEDDSLESVVIRTLTEKSQGIFLLATLQVESLFQSRISRSGRPILEELENLPRDLDAAYMRLLHQIEEQGPYARDLALKSFTWLFHSKAPLSLRDLQIAVAIEDPCPTPGEQYSNAKYNWGSIPVELLQSKLTDLNLDGVDAILDSCVGLMHQEHGSIRPIHRTFQEFVMNPPTKRLKMSILDSCRDVPLANERLALGCLRCIKLLPGFPSHHGVRMFDFIRAYPFGFYAAKYFDLHLKELQGIAPGVEKELESLLARGSRMSRVLWIRAMGPRLDSSDREVCGQRRIREEHRADEKVKPITLLFSTCLYDIPHIRQWVEEKFPQEYGYDEEEQPSLRVAAKCGNLSLVAQLLRNGHQPRAGYRSGKSPLYYASEIGDLPTFSLLLEYGAKVVTSGKSFDTPLQAASFLGNDEMAEIILKLGGEPDARYRVTAYPLHDACHRGHEKIARMLLDYGADINLSDKDSWIDNPLCAASANGHGRIVRMLLDRGASADACDYDTRNPNTALQAACAGGHYGVAKTLLDQGAKISPRGSGNALSTASFGGWPKIIRLLLHYGADINAQEHILGTPIEAASSAGFVDVIHLLLDHGADVNSQSSEGKYGNALQAASAKCHQEVVQLLLDRGADVHVVNTKSKYGTVLQAAAASGSAKIVQILLEHGSNVDIEDQKSRFGTALRAASGNGHYKVVEMLLDHGAGVNVKSDRFPKGNALHTASYGGFADVARLLIARGADLNAEGYGNGCPLQVAASEGNENMVQLLLDHGAGVDAVDSGGPNENALHHATSKNNEKLVKLLLDHGADPNGDNQAALRIALKGGHMAMVQLLLDRGADPAQHGRHSLYEASLQGQEQIVRLFLDRGANANGDKGDSASTPLAAAAGRPGHIGIVQMLLDHGADVNGDRDGPSSTTPLEKAAEAGNLEVVKLLLDHGADVHRNNAGALRNVQGYCRSERKEIMRLLLDHGAQVMPLKPGRGDVTRCSEYAGDDD
ncbi:hypothetical protein FQN54_004816 [Arachnomyces sp. PD_36]|nr:hypothetical protein FQN54_004816 [Arachnomyces sp. PD_36]